jgi:multidrug transporter EmrE-like cation transporter
MVFLVVTVLADVAGVVLLGKAQGLDRPGFLAAGIAALLVGFVLFSYATRTVPTGLANAVWAGASIVGVVVLGRIFLSETISGGQYACLGLILAGTVGISLLDRAPLS